MLKKCSWCNVGMGHAPGPAHLVTHGICPSCYAEQCAALDKMEARTRRGQRRVRPSAGVPACQRGL